MPINEKNYRNALSKLPLFRKLDSRKSCGPLHDRMTKFLPDFIDEGNDCVNLRRISVALNMSYQGVHKMMRPNKPNRVSPKVAEELVILSGMTKKRLPGFEPATIQDFWEFVNV